MSIEALDFMQNYKRIGLVGKRPRPVVMKKANTVVIKQPPKIVDEKSVVPFVRDWLLVKTEPGEIPAELIREAVCVRMGVRKSELMSRRQTRNVVRPRKVFAWICRKHTELSYFQIGGFVGGKDHTTIIHYERCVDAEMADFEGHIRSVQDYLQTKGFGV